MVEHSLGKGEVAGPIPAMGTINAVLVASNDGKLGNSEFKHNDVVLKFY